MPPVDFLVIGGGIAGVSAAARLSSLGSVTLIEAEEALGTQASGRSAALYEPDYGSPSTVALNRASLDYHQTADGGVLTPRGLLLVASAEAKDTFEADRTAMRLDPIAPDEARSLYPILNTDVVCHTAYSPKGQDIDTDKLLQGFARQLKRQGGTMLTRHSAQSMRRDPSGWTVTTPQAEITAKNIVNAAGAWADQIAKMADIPPLGLRRLRRSMARVPAPEGHDVSTWPMLMGPGEDWYSKPDAGALLVSPADEDLTHPHDAYPNDLTLAEGLARFEAHTHFETKRLLASWAGLRTFSPDGSLVIGPAPEDSSFLWCAGQGGYGMQSAPAVSQLLADLVSGRSSDISPADIQALSPSRFGLSARP